MQEAKVQELLRTIKLRTSDKGSFFLADKRTGDAFSPSISQFRKALKGGETVNEPYGRAFSHKIAEKLVPMSRPPVGYTL